MGNVNKAVKSVSEPKAPEQPRRRSLRNSLRLSKSGSKDILASTDRYLQTLNGEFDKGVIYNKTLDELNKIDTELEKILTDLTNLTQIGMNTAKRFELENSARYFRNKIKSAKGSHMNSAIQRLNENNSQPNYIFNNEVSASSSNNNVDNYIISGQIETNKEKIAAKLNEVSIKTREVLNLLESMSEVDEITKNSANMVIDRCKRELYNIQTRNDKLINKKWKCFRKIDEIKNILEIKSAITNQGSLRRRELSSEIKTEAQVTSDAYRKKIQNTDAISMDADVEDNSEKHSKERQPLANSNSTNRNSVEFSNSLSDANDQENRKRLREFKSKIKQIHSYVLSLEHVDQIIKNTTVDTLKKYKKELRNLQVNSGHHIRKKITYLKRLEEINAILHNKYCNDSDGDSSSSSLTVNNDEGIIKNLRTIPADNEERGTTPNKIQNEDLLYSTNGKGTKTSTRSLPDEPSSPTKRLSDKFDSTTRKINELFVTKSVSFEDLESVAQGIDEIHKEFDNILKKVSTITDMEEVANSTPNAAVAEDTSHEAKQHPEENSVEFLDDLVIRIDNPAHSNLEHKKYNEVKTHQVNVNNDISGSKSIQDFVSKNDSQTVASNHVITISENKANDTQKPKDNPDKKRYKQTFSVDDLDKSEKAEQRIKRYSEENLTKIESPTGSNLISFRNIDLSQIVSGNNKIYSLSGLDEKVYSTSVTTRNIDLSQLVCKDSDMSLSDMFTKTYDEHFSDVFTRENSDDNIIDDSSGEDGGITIVSPKLRKQSTSIKVTDNQRESVLETAAPSGDPESADYVSAELAQISKRLESVKVKIMNFVGVKSDDMYNELDEELVNIMLSLDDLKIQENNTSYITKEKIVGEVYRFSGMLEMKNLDHEYLDSCEKEINFVEKEIKQSFDKDKIGNLQNILSDIDDMIAELEQKIVDHLLVSRKENYIRKLNRFRDELKVFVK